MVYRIFCDLLTFPDPRLAEDDGLLAIGGDLKPERLVAAYRRGIYPWYTEGYPILWWCPDPRFVLFPDRIHVPRSLRKLVRQGRFTVTLNRDLRAVIKACAKVPRRDQEGTWITTAMLEAYLELHRAGHVVSVEAWQGAELAGGLYGVVIGRCFFGESMFAWEPNASKVAFVKFTELLRERGCPIIDCQMKTGHLERFGGEFIAIERFLGIIEKGCEEPPIEWPEVL